jgi:hypothetical protein
MVDSAAPEPSELGAASLTDLLTQVAAPAATMHCSVASQTGVQADTHAPAAHA